MGEPAIVAEGLVKRFGAVTALAGVDVQVPAGTVLGLLGPNGAGKTTMVRILATLLPPDAGRAAVLGHDVPRQPGAVRRVVGLSGQYAAVDAYLTGREYLRMIGRLSGLRSRSARRRADELLDEFDLSAAADRTARTYSGGMRRRLDVAASLVAQPSVLLLDEPTTGLDPRGRLGLWRLIAQLTEYGTTVLLTTQYLEEADRARRHHRGARPGPRHCRRDRRAAQDPGRWRPPRTAGRTGQRPAYACRRDGRTRHRPADYQPRRAGGDPGRRRAGDPARSRRPARPRWVAGLRPGGAPAQPRRCVPRPHRPVRHIRDHNRGSPR